MNIFEYAMQMEKDGEAYYRDLASRCNQEGLQKILLMLAQDEVGHYKAFQKLKDETTPEVATTEVLDNAKNVFVEMRGQLNDFNVDISEVEMYKKAIEVEKKSAAFYKEKANEIDDSEAKEVFWLIAGDEMRHQFLLENMVEFLSRPQSWVEDAEFNHLDEY